MKIQDRPRATSNSLLLINPNTSQQTTAMMLAIAQAELPDFTLYASTAKRGVSMIVSMAELNGSVEAVEECWDAQGKGCAGVLLACFGDPGRESLQALAGVPVVGLCEAAMRDAAHGRRRFGIVTTTPLLAPAIDACAEALNLKAYYTGLRFTPGDPHALVADVGALQQALSCAIETCIHDDGAEVVIVGGGPLGQLVPQLARQAAIPVLAPLVSATRHLRARVSAQFSSAMD